MEINTFKARYLAVRAKHRVMGLGVGSAWVASVSPGTPGPAASLRGEGLQGRLPAWGKPGCWCLMLMRHSKPAVLLLSRLRNGSWQIRYVPVVAGMSAVDVVLG